ncbi:NAD(P)H-dependent oxidoreductase [Pontixanthobacter aestiaquae]|uniref:Flavodoxin family protein n=1 Tax=Pontixanthobacter aestiaquae TaxID=1509367 RepID=A0A844Z8T8_9SPHN|nr:NAD(P)H-dependent oxidoreductase [Pontixanthobacter aestiaquae]MDN3645515.1 NAD(P)H-dependent oxidoreductase [Pontixanthobacter aestiaquae]MXO83487.1 flavodoxin family protein [Pontixanthobacter aestiaquae]
MDVLLLDGHPDNGRLGTHLLDTYERALPSDAEVTRIAVRDLAFEPILRHGYAKRTEWEPDIMQVAEALDNCDHLVVAFPMWWGSEPAELKGLLDRVLLPGFAFAYHDDDPWWDKLMEGRSADVIATMDTPPIFLRLIYGNPLVKRWKKQVLGFCGFKPVRFLACGPTNKGGAEKNLPKWELDIRRMAGSIKRMNTAKKRFQIKAFLKPAS